MRREELDERFGCVGPARANGNASREDGHALHVVRQRSQ
jgi:hypothetical protein